MSQQNKPARAPRHARETRRDALFVVLTADDEMRCCGRQARAHDAAPATKDRREALTQNTDAALGFLRRHLGHALI